MENSTPPPPSQAAQGSGGRHSSTASPPPSTSLHSVRKPPAKPWKKPAALPIPPKVYRVDPRSFRQLVQMLTGANDVLAPRRPWDAAPAPLQVVLPPRHCPSPPQPAAPPVQPYLHHGSASLPSPCWIPEIAHGSSAGDAVAPTAEPPQVSDDVGYQLHSQAYTAGIPSPSLYSACLTWCNVPLLSPGSMACLDLELSTVLL